MISKKTLQYVIDILALAPLLSGLIGLSGIFNPLFFDKLPVNLFLDSNLRFLNAMSVAVALSFYLILPVIEKETFACRIICFAIFLGGVGRLISMYDLGITAFPLLIFAAFELIFPPLIIYWQYQLASKANS